MGRAVIRRSFAALAAALLLVACSGQGPVSIASVSPTSGGPGTVLTVSGSGLSGSAIVTVCGVELEDLSLVVGERPVGVPGTVGSLPGATTLTGTVPDLGASADCSVAVSGPGGSDVVWSGVFRFQGVEGNQAPTTTGLDDVFVASDEASRVLDVSSAFDDPDDGASSLTFTVAVEAPAGNVTAHLDGTDLTLGFPSRFGDTAQVTVTATDPSGASVSASFTVAFEASAVRFDVSGEGPLDPDDVEVFVYFAGVLAGEVAGGQEPMLRSGSYLFEARKLVERGTYLHRFMHGKATAAVPGSGTTAVPLDLKTKSGAGRLWVPMRPAIPAQLRSYDDAALVGGGVTPTSTFESAANSSSVTRAPDGSLWVSGSSAVVRFDESDLDDVSPVYTTPLQSGSWAWVSNLAFDDRGDLWTAEYLPGRVSKFTADQVADGGSQTPVLTLSGGPDLELSLPGGLAFDRFGNLWLGTVPVDGSTSHIYRFDAAVLDDPEPRPSLVLEVALEGAWPRVFDFAFDKYGNVWYSTDLDRVGRVPAEVATASGSFTVDAAVGVHLPQPHTMGVAFDAFGNLWALDRSGTLTYVAADDLDQEAPPVTVFPLGVLVDIGNFELVD